MTIYISKDNESEQRFRDWEEVIEYAKARDKHDTTIQNIEKELSVCLIEEMEKKGYNRGTMKTDKCPKCGITWRDEKGWGINLLGLEIKGKYDGVSYWKCTACNTTFDRWTGEEVESNEPIISGNGDIYKRGTRGDHK